MQSEGDYMVDSYILRKKSGLPSSYNSSDRRTKMRIRQMKIEVEGRLYFDQPLTDAFSSSASDSIYSCLGIYKASDLLHFDIDSDPRASLLSRRTRKALSDYSWFLRFRLAPAINRESQEYCEYIDDHPSIFDYCHDIHDKAPKKIDRVTRYLCGECVHSISENEGCRVQDVKRSLEEFQRDSDFPWVYEDKFIEPFSSVPTLEEFRYIFPESAMTSFRYACFLMRIEGEPLPLVIK